MGSTEDYITAGRLTVEGWFDETDARTIAAAAAVTPDRGDLIEVGAYMGRSAILLGYLTGDGERVVVVDLFEDDAATVEQVAEQRRWYQDLSRGRFEANWLRFHDALPEILQGRSDVCLPQLEDRTARLIHIDASHSYEAVHGDIEHALRVATANAVLTFDDIRTHHTPGVAAAVWASVTDGRIVPLAQTPTKLYATPAGSIVTAGALAAALGSGVRVVDAHDVAGHPVLELVPPPEPVPPRWRRAVHRVGRRMARL